MKRFFFIAMFVLFVVASAASQARLPDEKMHVLILQGIDLTWKEKYSAADSLFRRVSEEFPEHPAGYVYQAGVVLSRAMDNELEVDLAKFDSLLSVGRLKAKALIDSGSDPTWGHFFAATADGSDSYARVYRGDWFGGTRKGFASVSSFKDAVKLDSTISDAFAGIGAFYYWRSRKTEFFNWIPFVGDDRSEAFALLKKSIAKGIYNKYTALSMLATIEIDAEMYDKAVVSCQEGLQQYPNSRTFLWGLATALHKSQQWSSAAAAYGRLLGLITTTQDNNHYNEIVCRLNLAKVGGELHDTSSVQTQLKSILRFHEGDFPAHVRARAKDKIDQAVELLQKYANAQATQEKQ